MHGRGGGQTGMRDGGRMPWVQETATEAGGTHPTGMHSCINFLLQENVYPEA